MHARRLLDHSNIRVALERKFGHSTYPSSVPISQVFKILYMKVEIMWIVKCIFRQTFMTEYRRHLDASQLFFVFSEETGMILWIFLLSFRYPIYFINLDVFRLQLNFCRPKTRTELASLAPPMIVFSPSTLRLRKKGCVEKWRKVLQP